MKRLSRAVVVPAALTLAVAAWTPGTDAQSAAARPGKPTCVVSDAGDPKAASVSTTFPAALDESRRKAIFADLSKAVDAARRDTAREYPARDSSSLSLSGPSDSSKSTRYTEAQRLMLRSAEIKHVAAVIRGHTLTCADARGVFREGRARKWPAPTAS